MKLCEVSTKICEHLLIIESTVISLRSNIASVVLIYPTFFGVSMVCTFVSDDLFLLLSYLKRFKNSFFFGHKGCSASLTFLSWKVVRKYRSLLSNLISNQLGALNFAWQSVHRRFQFCQKKPQEFSLTFPVVILYPHHYPFNFVEMKMLKHYTDASYTGPKYSRETKNGKNKRHDQVGKL